MSSDPTEAAKSPATNIPAVIKVAIIEDQRDIREGLAWIIRATEGFDCTGAFRSVEEAVEKIGFDLPHVVLTDIGLPGMSGVEGIRILKERHPKLLLLVLTVYEDDEMIFDALCAGACGYLLKKTSPTRLIESLREAMGGGAPMSPEVASRFIAFIADGRLKKIEVAGGPVLTLCEVGGIPIECAWSRDGVILFALAAVGLFRISATGGEVTQVTTLDRPRQESFHRFPTFLPDGRHFLYSIMSGQKETRGVYLGSLDGSVKRRLLDDVTAVKYMAAVPGDTASGAGWLLFARDGALLAQPFDTSRLDFTGEPFSLSDKVGSDLVYPNLSTFSVSDNGVLVFDPSLKRQRRQYRLVGRRGQPTNSLDAAAGLTQHWLSPDEKRFVADRLDPQTSTPDLWLCEVSGGKDQRFTFDPGIDLSPVWSPDGSRIVWASHRGGIGNLYQKAASLAGEDTPLLKSDHHKSPTDWSRDGRFISYYVLFLHVSRLDP